MGDLLICAAVVAREAKEQRRPEINHWAHLTIHAFCICWDTTMSRPGRPVLWSHWKQKSWRKLGISDPYVDLS